MLFRILKNENFDPQTKFIILFGYIFSLLIAFTIHEFGHAKVAQLNGDDTAKNAGRVTLNPFKHMDLIGMFLLAVIGLGWAKPVPVNADNFKKRKLGIITVSLAGVTTNLIASMFAFFIIFIMSRFEAVANALVEMLVGDPSGLHPVVYVLILLIFFYFFFSATINAALLAFNILPFYPLDGFHVIEILSKPGNKVVYFLKRYGFTILIVIMIVGSLLENLTGIIYFDIFGLYMNAVVGGIQRLCQLMFGWTEKLVII